MSNVFLEISNNVSIEVLSTQLNASLKTLLSNFNSKAAPSNNNLIIGNAKTIPPNGTLFVSEETHSLYRKVNVSSGIYSSPTGTYGSRDFTRRGISYRVEPSLSAATANTSAYETGESLYTILEDDFYYKNSNGILASIWEKAQANDSATIHLAWANDYLTYRASLANDSATYDRILNQSSFEFTANKTFQQDVVVKKDLQVQELLYVKSLLQNTYVASTPSNNVIDFNILEFSSILNTSNSTGNTIINVRGNSSTSLDSLLDVGHFIDITFVNPKGTSIYYANTIQIDSTTVTPKWKNLLEFSGISNNNCTDLYSYKIYKIASNSYQIFANREEYL